MPKATFFGLEKSKQDRLVAAAMQEFSRVSLNEASIAKIIKSADIPRGSFYQYFENKEDLYHYCFSLLKDNSKRELEDFLQENHGDVFAGFNAYFDKLVHDVFEGENAAFFRNLFLYMDYRSSKQFFPDKHVMKKNNRKASKAKIREYIDVDRLNVSDEESLKILIRLMMVTTFQTIGDAYAREVKKGEKIEIKRVKKEYALKINWLKYGAYRSE